MHANALRWLKPEKKTKELLVDAIVLEQIVNTLGATVKNWIQKNNPKTLDEALRLLEDYNTAEETSQENSSLWGGAR